ncbi:MAG: GNAT family N-acetyltransferase [Chloroflexi bacterium]|nr:GNAT family N-acetyltransferase [Chloroflexota bacterium]
MRPGSQGPGPLKVDEVRRLLQAIDETPETVIPIHLLRFGTSQAYAVGDAGSPDAVVVQRDSLPEEPFGLGTNAQGLWDLLRGLDGWTCVEVVPAVAPRLGALMNEATGVRVRYYEGVYHTLTEPAPVFEDSAVRQLGIRDAGLLAGYGIHGGDFGSLSRLLLEGVVAGAVVDGQVVGTAHTSAVIDRYADIGVETQGAWRGRGFATAAASIVARRVQEQGRIPVWSCGEDNLASLRVAEKLGFEEVSRLTYVIKGT